MLTSPQLRLLHQGLLQAFNESELEDLIGLQIGVPISRIVTQDASLSGKAFEIIQAAERAGWTRDLVQAAYDARPVVPQFVELYQAIGLASDVSLQQAGIKTASAQKSTSLGPDQFIPDIGRWRERLASVSACVCRIEIGTRIMATGFLVAPDIVATCYHVMESVFDGRETPENVRIRFDYRVDATDVTPGRIVQLHPGDWKVSHSPYSVGELTGAAKAQPSFDQLDYALIRLDYSIGAEPRDNSTGSGSRRGWLELPTTNKYIRAGMPLLIMQYASGGPQKLAFDTDAVRGLNENQTRVYYSTNTEFGSSGAPCFDADWELVAINQGVTLSDNASPYNQGIPTSTIRQHLARIGKLAILPAPMPDTRLSAENRPPVPGSILYPDDPQKGRWGGLAERSGRKLTVNITEVQRTYFMFEVIVVATDGSPLRPPVIFHLHDSYARSVIRITKVRDDQRAGLYEVKSNGVYVIGAQVRDAAGTWIGLELDLTTAENLPTHFLDK